MKTHPTNGLEDITWFELILGLMMIPVFALTGLSLWVRHFIEGKLRKGDQK